MIELILVGALLGAMQDTDEGPGDDVTFSFSDTTRVHKAFLVENELQVTLAGDAGIGSEEEAFLTSLVDGATLLEISGGTAILRSSELTLKNLAAEASRLEADPKIASVRPVVYPTAKTWAQRSAGRRLYATRKLVVRPQAGQDVDALAAIYGATVLEELAYWPGTFLFEVESALDSLKIAQSLVEKEGVAMAMPALARPMAKKVIRTPKALLVPDDPLFVDQWHLQNTGQSGGTSGEDVNILTAWDTTLGAGVVIAILDDGLETTHPDLEANHNDALAIDYLDNDPDPNPEAFDDHGTAVAGVAAAVGDNTLGVSGAAPSATLVGIRMLGGGTTSVTEAAALSHKLQDIHVYNNSWGPPDNGTLNVGNNITQLVEQALKDGVVNGRGGLGVIYTWAAGNGLADNDDANLDGYANSPYTIAIGASSDEGGLTDYGEPGACLIVNAPSGTDDFGADGGIVTTDQSGALGYNAGADPDYAFDFSGTSSATPLASGVVALILAANNGLTWRDVQHVLIDSASKNDPGHGDWTTNGVGRNINHYYGFGRVNASSAVSLASTWTNVAPSECATQMAPNSIPIPDFDPVGISDTLTVTSGGSVEHVQVKVNILHDFRGEVEVTLTSPMGTTSVLARARFEDTGPNYVGWTFMTVRNWGESPTGDWTLRVYDLISGGVGGSLVNWTLTINGVGVDDGTCTSLEDPEGTGGGGGGSGGESGGLGNTRSGRGPSGLFYCSVPVTEAGGAHPFVLLLLVGVALMVVALRRRL